ncbi:MAG: hypothetical protein AAF627_16010 [Myxococcota bacterium]
MRTAGLVLALLVLGAAAAGYQWARSRFLTGLYAERLEGLSQEYARLREQYDQAVEASAVTEILVDPDHRVSVVVRSTAGILRRIETPFDGRNELHVDFVVQAGRLFIRRVYDERTPPRHGLLVDPELAELDWSDPAVARGLSVYRGRLVPGRWLVTTTGNGALDLERAPTPPVPLEAAPRIRNFEAVEEAIEEDYRQVTSFDVVRRAWQTWSSTLGLSRAPG